MPIPQNTLGGSPQPPIPSWLTSTLGVIPNGVLLQALASAMIPNTPGAQPGLAQNIPPGLIPEAFRGPPEAGAQSGLSAALPPWMIPKAFRLPAPTPPMWDQRNLQGVSAELAGQLAPPDMPPSPPQMPNDPGIQLPPGAVNMSPLPEVPQNYQYAYPGGAPSGNPFNDMATQQQVQDAVMQQLQATRIPTSFDTWTPEKGKADVEGKFGPAMYDRVGQEVAASPEMQAVMNLIQQGRMSDEQKIASNDTNRQAKKAADDAQKLKDTNLLAAMEAARKREVEAKTEGEKRQQWNASGTNQYGQYLEKALAAKKSGEQGGEYNFPGTWRGPIDPNKPSPSYDQRYNSAAEQRLAEGKSAREPRGDDIAKAFAKDLATRRQNVRARAQGNSPAGQRITEGGNAPIDILSALGPEALSALTMSSPEYQNNQMYSQAVQAYMQQLAATPGAVFDPTVLPQLRAAFPAAPANTAAGQTQPARGSRLDPRQVLARAPAGVQAKAAELLSAGDTEGARKLLVGSGAITEGEGVRTFGQPPAEQAGAFDTSDPTKVPGVAGRLKFLFDELADPNKWGIRLESPW